MRKLSLIFVMAVLCSGLIFAKGEKNKGSEEKNKETARKVFDDLFTGGHYEQINSMYEPNAVVHLGGRTISLSEAVSEGKGWKSAFPDAVMRAHRITGNGDNVEVHWSVEGTNKGTAEGLPGKGKKGKAQGSSRFRFTNGKIAEVWVDWDEQNLRRQVGGK
ncbi:MAG TPA: ester cyclase [Candidatus Angelobacter sp.]